MKSIKMKNPVNQRFTGFLLPFKGLFAEKEELSIIFKCFDNQIVKFLKIIITHRITHLFFNHLKYSDLQRGFNVILILTSKSA